MKRERWIWAFVLFAALAAFWAVYQFYFKQKLADYAKDATARKNAEDAYVHLADVFKETDPEGVIAMWRNVVQPWKDTVLERGKYFNDGEWWKHTEPSEEVAILRFWYNDQLQQMVNKLYQDLNIARTQGLAQYPTDFPTILKELGVKQLSEFPNNEVTKKDVNRELGKLATGMKVYEMIAKAKASYISHVWLWPAREVKDHEGVLRLWTIGLDFGIDMKNFVTFVDDKLRTEDRFWNIEGIKIQYPYVGYNVEPTLRVQMLLTNATFIAARSGTDDSIPIGPVTRGARPDSVARNLNLKGDAAKQPAEETGFWAWWKWFKRDILAFG